MTMVIAPEDLVALAEALDLAEAEKREAERLAQAAVTANPEPLPSDVAELAAAAYRLTGLKLAGRAICPGHTAPLKAFADAYFGRHRVIVWKASRGLGGKTTMLALLGHLETVLLGAEVTILGGSGQQSQRVHEAQERFWAHPDAPVAKLASDPTKYETRLTNGGRTVALLASTRSARGPHPQRLRLDECDEIALPIFDAALGQTLSARGIEAQTVMSSTHQYADGTMTEILKRATDRGWPVYEWCVSYGTMVSTPDGRRRICDMRAGDRIYTYDGSRFRIAHVNAAWSNGRKPTVRVITTAGIVECTPEHRLLTDQGWRAAGSLRPHDRLLGLWTSDQRDQEQDRPVLEARPAGVPSVPAAYSKRDGLRVREVEAREVEGLSRLLPAADDPPQFGEPGRDDAGARNGAFSTAPVVARSAGRGTVLSAWHRVSTEFRRWALRSRLLRAGLQRRDRGVRPASSEVCRRDRARPGARAGSQGGRLPLRDPLRSRYASVVAVAPGRVVDVWDLSVPGFHNFVANGLVAHNCYRENHVSNGGWVDDAQIEGKRSEVTRVMWDAEYELGEPSPESRAIQPEMVDAMFRADLGTFGGRPGEAIEIEPPREGATYATGADWAKDRDWTVVWTLRTDLRPMRLVAYRRDGRRPWPLMVEILDQRQARYPGPTAHDATGLGDVVDDLLSGDADGVKLVGRARADLLSEYIKAIENGEIEAPRIEHAYGEHKFATLADVYGSGHLPDSICAGALALYAHRHPKRKRAAYVY